MTPDPATLRRVVLAVSVIDDVDLDPGDDGVVLRTADGRAVPVTWSEVRRALAGHDDIADTGHRRVAAWLRGRVVAASYDEEELRRRARPVGIPVDDPLHPGLDWVRQRVLGDVLDLGVGFVGVGADPDAVVVVPQGCLDAMKVDPAPWWPVVVDYLERMGALAADRLRATRSTTLRPIGDCDVVTLLGSRSLRTALANQDGTGLRAAAVPMRTRGWLDLSRIDPAFTVAAAAATAEAERGFPRPLLLTAEEVTLAPAGGHPAEIVLRDPAARSPDLRDVLYR
jgi:hypothetical protein